MSKLMAGFGRVNVTPMLGIGIAGYYKERFAEGVLDDLEINALALACGEDRVVLLSMDHCGLKKDVMEAYRRHVSEATGIPFEAVFIAVTHTHTGPILKADSQDPLIREYYQLVYRKMADAACLALQDLKPANMGWRIGNGPHVAFVRRFRMKDGGIRTNPGVKNPEIDSPIGDVDERVNVLRFDQENGKSLVLVNFGNHPDMVGGSKISADWPGFLRRTVEKSLDNTRCIFFNGAQGDVNHVNVWPESGDLNDTFMDFDDVSRGYGHARYVGRVIAGAVLQVFDKVEYVEVDSLGWVQRDIQVPSNRPTPEEVEKARGIAALHRSGKDEEIPFKGMELTTVVAEAERMLDLEHGPEAFSMPLSGIRIGNIAMLGIPGEPFTGIGRALKDTEGFALILPCCLANGAEGYFPMKEAYDEGGYESRSSKFKAGVAELIIREGKELLKELRR